MEAMEDYELPERPMDPPSSWQKEAQFRSATYPPSHLSYEPIGYEDIPDDNRLIETAMDRNRPGDASRDFGNDCNGSKLQSMPRQLLWTWILALLSGLWMAFTVIFALNCSLPKPFAARLLPSRSEDMLFILNACSHGTVLLLAALTSRAFETVRWALASSKRGIPARSFLGLSRATGLLGALNLFIGGDRGGYLRIDGQQFWGIQRLFLFLLNVAVGIALLSNVSVVPFWRDVEPLNFHFSGLGPINATIAEDTWPLQYWAWLYSLLSTPNYVITVPPTLCSLGNDCQSYYLTGSVYNLSPSSRAFRDHSEASLFIVENSIGYQIDYYPPLNTDSLEGAECGTYGADDFALHICIKQSDHDLLAGLSYCTVTSNCMNDTSWYDNYNSVLKVTISQRRASVVYSRLNDSILNIFDVGDPQPTNYGPNDFFPIFEMAMTDYVNDSTGLQYIYWVAGQGSSSSPYTNSFILMDLLAIPVGQFNDPTYWFSFPAENWNTTGALAVPSYRFIISSPSLYGFIAGSALLLFWFVVLIAVCMGVQIPNSSNFPEIDFASKCIELNTTNEPSPIARLLFPLGNANSSDIRKRFEHIRLFVGAGESGRGGIQHVSISIGTRLGNLVKKKLYN